MSGRIMDVLADVLFVTRMGGAVVAQAELVPPWCLDVDPVAEAHVHVVQRGSRWLRTSLERKYVRLGAGDVVRSVMSSCSCCFNCYAMKRSTRRAGMELVVPWPGLPVRNAIPAGRS